jgi:translation initiation factor IF-3
LAGKEKDLRINEYIRSTMLRIVSDEGPVGVMSKREALDLAESKQLDLVEIAPQANPPVAKLMDYGKFCYQQKKTKKKHTKSMLKEIKLRVNTEDNDIHHKGEQVKKFISTGHKVKVTVCFVGRQLSHKELGFDILNRMVNHVGACAKMEKEPTLEGKNLIVYLVAA